MLFRSGGREEPERSARREPHVAAREDELHRRHDRAAVRVELVDVDLEPLEALPAWFQQQRCQLLLLKALEQLLELCLHWHYKLMII